jgi:molybdopterin-binding protein
MNELPGKILSIQESGKMAIVKLDCEGTTLSSIVLEKQEYSSLIAQDKRVRMIFKETEVGIATGQDLQISYRNQLPCTISKIERGDLLSQIYLQFGGHELSSLITSESVDRLGLTEGKKVVALIKTNELMLAKL